MKNGIKEKGYVIGTCPHARPPLVCALFGLIISGVSAGMLYDELHYLDYYPILFFLAPVVVFMILWGIIDAIRAKAGLKAKKIEKLRQESVERLSHKDYALELAARGYDVPEKYL